MADESQPTGVQASRPAPRTKRSKDEDELARQLFVKLYPSPGSTKEHLAKQAIADAKLFTDILHH